MHSTSGAVLDESAAAQVRRAAHAGAITRLILIALGAWLATSRHTPWCTAISTPA